MPTTKPKTPQQKATETYTANKLDEGLVRIHPWVPKRFREAVLSFCEGLRQGDKTILAFAKKLDKLEDE